jgi:hypothetical protein
MEAREVRLAKNEAVFREVNERVIEIKEALGPDPRSSKLIDGLICECSDPGCVERVGPLKISDYEAVRADPRRFIIAANHQALDVESVLEMNSTFWVVEKREGVPAEVARERDPRG